MPKKATTFCMPESHCNHKYMYLDRPSTSKNAAILGLSPIYNKHIKQKKPTHTTAYLWSKQYICLDFQDPSVATCGNHPWGSHKSSVWECSLGSLPLQPSSGESIGLVPAAHEITWIMWSEWNQQNRWGVSLIISRNIGNRGWLILAFTTSNWLSKTVEICWFGNSGQIRPDTADLVLGCRWHYTMRQHWRCYNS
jgi:hypothetical protein